MSNVLIQQYQEVFDEESQQTLIEDWINEAHYNEQRFEQLIEFGNYYESLGHVELALMIYLRLQTIEPQTRLILFIVEAYAHIYEYEKALHWFQLIPEDEIDAKMRYQQSQWLIEIDRVDEAKDILTELVKKYPTYSDPYFLLANYYESQGDTERALTLVEAIYAYFSDSKIRSKARQKIVELKLNQEQIPLVELEKLMTDNELPLTEANDYYLLAMIYRLSQKNDLAKEAIKKSLSLDSNNPLAIDLLVELEKNDDTDDNEQLIDWFQDNIPENYVSPVEIASLGSEQKLDESLIQRLIGYLAYTVDIEEQYQIIRAVFKHFLAVKNLEGFDDFLNEHASNYLSLDELSYFLGRRAFLEGNYMEAIDQFEIARDLLIPEMDLIEWLVKSYEAVDELEMAQSLAEEYRDSEYETDYLKQKRRRKE